MRLIPGWKPILLVAAPLALGAGALVATLLYTSSQATSAASATQPTPPSAAARAVPPVPGLLVHVSGAVVNPGLYRLPRGDRVYDAIAAAGGLRADADPKRLPNLAGRLRDGEQIKVAFTIGSSGTVTSRTNLNTASLEELEALPGFSEAFAMEVIDYRTNFGGFQNTRELVDHLGMSEADYVIARRYLTL
jgi:competence protein ComEA